MRSNHSREVRRPRPQPTLPKATATPTPRLVAGIGAAFVVVALLVLITHQLTADVTPLAAPATHPPAFATPTLRPAPTRAPEPTPEPPTAELPPIAPAPAPPPVVEEQAPPMIGQGATWAEVAPEPITPEEALREILTAVPCMDAPAPPGIPECITAAPPVVDDALRVRAEDDCNSEHGRCEPPCTAEHGRCKEGDE